MEKESNTSSQTEGDSLESSKPLSSNDSAGKDLFFSTNDLSRSTIGGSDVSESSNELSTTTSSEPLSESFVDPFTPAVLKSVEFDFGLEQRIANELTNFSSIFDARKECNDDSISDHSSAGSSLGSAEKVSSFTADLLKIRKERQLEREKPPRPGPPSESEYSETFKTIKLMAQSEEAKRHVNLVESFFPYSCLNPFFDPNNQTKNETQRQEAEKKDDEDDGSTSEQKIDIRKEKALAGLNLKLLSGGFNIRKVVANKSEFGDQTKEKKKIDLSLPRKSLFASGAVWDDLKNDTETDVGQQKPTSEEPLSKPSD